MNQLSLLDVVALAQVSGGQQKPPAQPQQQQPQQQQQQQPQQQQPHNPPPQGNSDTQWISNTVRCARVGGPVLGALCGIFTSTPAY